MLPVSVFFPLTFARRDLDLARLPANHYRSYAARTMRGGSSAQFVQDMAEFWRAKLKYQIAPPAVCPLQTSVTLGEAGRGRDISSISSNSQTDSASIPYEQWIHESYELLGSASIKYSQHAHNVCVKAGRGSLLVFALSAGLHYLPVSGNRRYIGVVWRDDE